MENKIKCKNVIGGFIACSLLFGTISKNEGKINTAYLDAVGIPTICYGHTGGVSMGSVLSDEECSLLLNKDAKWAVKAFEDNVKVKVSPHTATAIIDFIFNVGENNFKNSTMLKKLNNGDINGACNEFPKWVYAKGIKLKGLETRRNKEKELCLMY